MAAGKRHAAEAELLKFLGRPDQTSDYVRRTAEWIKAEFPDSVPALIPKMRVLYREKKQNESRG